MAAPHPPDTHTLALARVLRALGDPVRLSIARRLAAEHGLSCGALGEDRPKSSMSHHFRVLREAGVIRSEPCGASVTNTLRRDELDRRFPGLLAAILGAGAG